MQESGRMNTYISLLRGINVSGYKKIKMVDLINLYKSLKFDNVRTYVQSGNVIFGSELSDVDKISVLIELKLKKYFASEVKVLIRTNKELQQILRKNPFLKNLDDDRLYVTFLSSKTVSPEFGEKKIFKNGEDKFYIIGKEIYLHCPDGYGRTKLTNNYFEKKLNVSATARNWNTVNKLNQLSK